MGTAAFQSQTAVQQDDVLGEGCGGHRWCGPPLSRAAAFPALKSRAQITFSHRCNILRFWKLGRTWTSVTQATARTNSEGVWFLPGPNSSCMLGMRSYLSFLLKQQTSVKAPFAAGKVMLTQVLQGYPTDPGLGSCHTGLSAAKPPCSLGSAGPRMAALEQTLDVGTWDRRSRELSLSQNPFSQATSSLSKQPLPRTCLTYHGKTNT